MKILEEEKDIDKEDVKEPVQTEELEMAQKVAKVDVNAVVDES